MSRLTTPLIPPPSQVPRGISGGGMYGLAPGESFRGLITWWDHSRHPSSPGLDSGENDDGGHSERVNVLHVRLDGIKADTRFGKGEGEILVAKLLCGEEAMRRRYAHSLCCLHPS